MKLLIMGLPGSGKTWLGTKLGQKFGIPYWDADDVRNVLRQAHSHVLEGDHVLVQPSAHELSGRRRVALEVALEVVEECHLAHLHSVWV